MTILKKILTAKTVCAFFLLSGKAHAQYIERQIVASTGYSSTLPKLPIDEYGTQMEYTVGDVAVRTLKYPEVGQLTQGFQQPPLQNLLKIQKDDMLVFPNPTLARITVMYNLDTANVQKIDIRVVSIGGNIMFTDKYIPDGTPVMKKELDCTRLIPGIYVVTLILDTGIKVSRKFIKFD